LIVTVLGLLSSVLGIVSVSTPSRKDASTRSAKALLGSVNERLQEPYVRSAHRWYTVLPSRSLTREIGKPLHGLCNGGEARVESFISDLAARGHDVVAPIEAVR
jgi:hypothetical protein